MKKEINDKKTAVHYEWAEGEKVVNKEQQLSEMFDWK